MNYEMTQEDLNTLLDAMKPVPTIMLQCGTPPSVQQRANDAWAKLGEKMHFDPSTVKPTGQGDRFFSATSLKPRLKKDGNEWCAVWPGFIDLQQSPAGFGATPDLAIQALNLPLGVKS